VLVPITADRLGSQGFPRLVDTINMIRYSNKRLNLPDLPQLGGLLIVKTNMNLRVSKDYYEFLKKMAKSLNSDVYTTYIRESTKIREAQALCKSIYEYDLEGNGIKDYYNFVDEFIARHAYALKPIS